MVAPDDLTPLASGFPQCGTADVEIMVPSVENPELLKVLSFKHGIGQSIKIACSPGARNSILLTSTSQLITLSSSSSSLQAPSTPFFVYRLITVFVRPEVTLCG